MGIRKGGRDQSWSLTRLVEGGASTIRAKETENASKS